MDVEAVDRGGANADRDVAGRGLGNRQVDEAGGLVGGGEGERLHETPRDSCKWSRFSGCEMRTLAQSGDSPPVVYNLGCDTPTRRGPESGQADRGGPGGPCRTESRRPA